MTAEHTIIPPVSADPRGLYLDLLKKSLMCSLYEDLDGSIGNPGPGLRPKLLKGLMLPHLRLVAESDRQKRREGLDWPALAVAMIGGERKTRLRPHAATNSSTPGTDKRTGAVTH